MSVWQRMKRLVKSSSNALLDKLESPEQELRMLDEDIRAEKKEAQRRLTEAIVEQKRLEKELEREAEAVEKWEKHAIRAIEAGDDALAKEALVQKAKHEHTHDLHAEEVRAQRQAVERLKEAQKELEIQAQRALQKRDMLLGRLETNKIHKTLSIHEEDSPMAEFERISQSVERLEAEAEIAQELSGELAEAEFDRKLKALEREKASEGEQLDDALAALKARMKEAD